MYIPPMFIVTKPDTKSKSMQWSTEILQLEKNTLKLSESGTSIEYICCCDWKGQSDCNVSLHDRLFSP